ncbi:hypothetical protein [Roseicyclus sp.]
MNATRSRACLHAPWPIEGCVEEDETHEACQGLFAAQGDATGAFDPLEQGLDRVAFGLKVKVFWGA